jgi:hypothetical protein
MRRWALVLVLLAAGCGEARPFPDAPLIRVRTASREVQLGRGFPLSVVRVFAKTAEPPIWTDEYLEPLHVRLLGTETRGDDRFVEETRRYQAYAFSLGGVTVPALSDADVPLEIRVIAALDPDAPGPAEPPEGPLEAPFRGWWWVTLAAALAASAAFFRSRRGRARPEPAAVEEPLPAPSQDPAERALERIRRLRATEPDRHEEHQAFHVEASSILRDFLFEEYGLAAELLTTEEILDARPPSERRSLASALAACDFVKFARHHPDRDARNATLDAARAFVSGAP